MAGEWDPTTPDDHFLISGLPESDRNIKNNTLAIIEKEHRELGDGNSGGEHQQGSAIVFFLPTASAPTQDPAGENFVTADLGRLWFDTTTLQLKVLESIGPIVWKIIPTTAAAVDFLSTITVQDTIAIDSILDDDTMDNATETSLSTSESIKTYVDNTVSVDGVAGAVFEALSESVELANGLIMKMGYTARTGTLTTVSFADNFSGLTSILITGDDSAGASNIANNGVITAQSVSGFQIPSTSSAIDGWYWTAWGY